MQDVNNLASTYGIDIFSLIGAEKGITFNGGSTYNEAGSIGGEYIEKCTYDYQNQWIVNIEIIRESYLSAYLTPLFKNTGNLVSHSPYGEYHQKYHKKQIPYAIIVHIIPNPALQKRYTLSHFPQQNI